MCNVSSIPLPRAPAAPNGARHVAPAPQHVTARDSPPSPGAGSVRARPRPPPPPAPASGPPRPAAPASLAAAKGAGGSGGSIPPPGAAARPHPRRWHRGWGECRLRRAGAGCRGGQPGPPPRERGGGVVEGRGGAAWGRARAAGPRAAAPRGAAGVDPPGGWAAEGEAACPARR